MLFESILNGVIIPLVIFAGLLGLATRLPLAFRRPLTAISAPLAFVAAYSLLNGWPKWPPDGSDQSLFYLIILTSLWPLIEPWLGFLRWWVARWPLVVFLVYWVLKPLFEYQEMTWAFLLSVLVSVLSGGLLWWLIDAGVKSRRASVWALLLLIPSASLAIVCLLNGSALLAQLTGVVCVVLGVILAGGLILNLQEESRALTPFVVVGFFGLWLQSRFFLEAGWGVLGLLALSVALPMFWPRRWTPSGFQEGIKHAALLLILALIPAAVALLISWGEYNSSAIGYY